MQNVILSYRMEEPSIAPQLLLCKMETGSCIISWIFASGTATPFASRVWTMPSCLLPLERAWSTNSVSCSRNLVSVPPWTKTDCDMGVIKCVSMVCVCVCVGGNSPFPSPPRCAAHRLRRDSACPVWALFYIPAAHRRPHHPYIATVDIAVSCPRCTGRAICRRCRGSTRIWSPAQDQRVWCSASDRCERCLRQPVWTSSRDAGLPGNLIRRRKLCGWTL